MHALANFAESWTLRLLAASLQGAVLAAVVWLLCRWMPSLPAAVRGRLWWLVCAQMVLGLLWPDAMKLHLLHQPPLVPASASSRLPVASDVADAAISPTAQPGIGSWPTPPAAWTMDPASPLPGWRTLLLLVWLAGTAAGLLLLVGEHRVHGRRLRRSHPADTDLQRLLEQEARTVGLHRVPRLRVAPDIRSPQVIGLRRPTVLMPQQDLSTWSRADLVLALRHECLHLHHHDLWWGWGPVLAQRLFFFNPVAAIAAREFALAREAAVDDALLRQPDVSARRYGALLLRLGVSRSGTTVMATASPSFRILHRRLTMMNTLSTPGRAANVAATLALLLVAGASLPLSATPTGSAAPAVPTVPTVPAVAPVAAVPAVPPAPSVARSGKHDHSHTYVFDDGKSGTSVDIDGSDDDGNKETRIIVSDGGKEPQVLKIRKDPASQETRVWYHDGDKSYVIDDDDIRAKIEAVLAPMKKFGEQQGKLGEQQGLLSGKQAELGAEQGRLGQQQARLAGEMAKAQGRGSDGKSMDDWGHQQDALGQQQDELGHRQDELGQQQDALGKQQDELGKQQDQVTRDAAEQIRQLMKQAIANGLAKPAKG